MNKLRLKEVKYFAQSHRATKKYRKSKTQVLNAIAGIVGCSFFFSKSILNFFISETQQIKIILNQLR